MDSKKRMFNKKFWTVRACLCFGSRPNGPTDAVLNPSSTREIMPWMHLSAKWAAVTCVLCWPARATSLDEDACDVQLGEEGFESKMCHVGILYSTSKSAKESIAFERSIWKHLQVNPWLNSEMSFDQHTCHFCVFLAKPIYNVVCSMSSCQHLNPRNLKSTQGSLRVNTTSSGLWVCEEVGCAIRGNSSKWARP